MVYLPRVIDGELDELMTGLPAISLEGPRGVGKTATASRRAATVLRIDDPDVLDLVSTDRSAIDAHPGTVLLDEWQHYPPAWDYVRRAVDDGAPAGRFLLTGSAVPTELPFHSGAGRIVSMRMRTLSLAERGVAQPSVSLRSMLAGDRPPVRGECEVGLRGYVEEIVASGFPAIRAAADRLRRPMLESYVRRILDRDFPELGLSVRRPATLRGWLTAYAAATATTASYNTILAAATPGEADKPAKTTTTAYRDVLNRLWLLDPVEGWIPLHNELGRLMQAPKHHLADPALAAHLLNVDVESLLMARPAGPPMPREGSLLGHLFESLVTLSVRVYAQAAQARLHHLRTPGGRQEVDLIVEGPGRRVVALEVKLTATSEPRSFKHLLWLKDRLGDDLVDAAVITAGKYAFRRPDGIAVIPAALLGP